MQHEEVAPTGGHSRKHLFVVCTVVIFQTDVTEGRQRVYVSSYFSVLITGLTGTVAIPLDSMS